MLKGALIKRFKQFCLNLNAKDKIAIVHHGDPDGFCSALIAARAVEKLRGRKPEYVAHYEYNDVERRNSILQKCLDERFNKGIILDISADSSPKVIELIEKHCDALLIIDHHKLYKDLNNTKTVFLKAQFFTEKDPSTYVSAKLCFDLFNQIVDVHDMDWIACIGILGDMNYKNWQPFFKETLERRKLELQDLQRMMELIAGCEVVSQKGMQELFWLFYEAKNPKEVLKEKKFSNYVAKMNSELQALVDGFERNAEHYPEMQLHIYTIKPKYEGAKSYVVNALSQQHPNETIVLIQDTGGEKLRFSARRQDGRIKMNDLLENAVKGIPDASAGGHVPAAAGSVPRQYVEKFKENVKRLLKSEH